MTTIMNTQRPILVIEDDDALGLKLKSILLQISTEVDLVECGDAAVEAIRSRHYHLLVVDIWLPMTAIALGEKRLLEDEYDAMTELLMATDSDEQRKTELRERMEKNVVETRGKLERRGGLMILERCPAIWNPPGAILFLTAIGNAEMRHDAESVARNAGYERFLYLVKPQSPEAIQARAKGLLFGEESRHLPAT
jgi:CheY-like chemotaxis protein